MAIEDEAGLGIEDEGGFALEDEGEGRAPMNKALSIQNCILSNATDPVVISRHTSLTVVSGELKLWVYHPELTLTGGYHNNTAHIIYDGADYLRCTHQNGDLTGIYKSPIFTTGAGADRYLVYIVGKDTAKADIAVIGAGTTWDDQLPVPNTWNSVNVSTNTWTNIFELDKGPSVEMRLYYGQVSPPTNYTDKMEILSAIVEDAIYFQVQITITDPVSEVYAYVEEFNLRLCQ